MYLYPSSLKKHYSI